MFRKLSLAAVAAVSLGAAALAPTPAAAWGWHGGYGWHGGGYGTMAVGGRAARASTAMAAYRSPMAMAAAIRASSFPPPGGPAGIWSTAATERPAIRIDCKTPASRRGLLLGFMAAFRFHENFT